MQHQNDTNNLNRASIPSSPQPLVEKGGDNEFVEVAHLASVEVKAVPVQLQGILKHPKKRTQAARNGNRMVLPTSTRRLSLSDSYSSGEGTTKSHSNHENGNSDDDNFPLGENMHCDETLYGEDDNRRKVVTMEAIEKSPYEPEASAEDGVFLFEEMKELLLGNATDDNEKAIPQKLVQMFGPTNAECLMKAAHLIEISGMSYSQTWNKGSIRGDPVGIIPNHLLLIVLVPTRFVKASELLLSGLCRDLEVFSYINQGLDDWGWANDYPLVRATKKNYKFRTRKRNAFKCAVFVARAYSCFLAFGKEPLTPELSVKLKTCFDLMETCLADPYTHAYFNNSHAIPVAAIDSNPSSSSSLKSKKRRRVPDATLSTSSFSLLPSEGTSKARRKSRRSHSSPPPSTVNDDLSERKQKCGGLRRCPTSTETKPEYQKPISILESTDDDLIHGESESRSKNDTEKLVSERPQPSRLTVRSSITGNKSRRSATTRSKTEDTKSGALPTLQSLVFRFENQYKEMGERYAEMGRILAELKTTVAEQRTPSEEDIRMEVLEEVQSAILESLPKK